MKPFLAAAIILAIHGSPCAFANEAQAQPPLIVLSSADEQATVSALVAKQVAADPSRAGEIVKAAIISHKADAALIVQIVKAAVTAAADQADSVRACAIAVAPDARPEIEALIAALLKGDQVAATAATRKKLDENANATNEPEGDSPQKNQVWLGNKAPYLYDGRVNPLRSFTANTENSPNAYHNQTGVIRGGGTVVVRPTSPTGP